MHLLNILAVLMQIHSFGSTLVRIGGLQDLPIS